MGEYKHITVTAADEDVVIHAGVARAEPEPAPAPAPEPVAASEPEPVPSTQPSGRAEKDDAYRETTIEDLETEPMPAAQRIVIIAAVLCIIGALVYYFVFMR